MMMTVEETVDKLNGSIEAKKKDFMKMAKESGSPEITSSGGIDADGDGEADGSRVDGPGEECGKKKAGKEEEERTSTEMEGPMKGSMGSMYQPNMQADGTRENMARVPLDAGTEVFEFVDTLFYKVDKSFQNGITGIIDYFANTNIMLDDMIEYNTKTPNIVELYKARPTLQDHIKDDVKFYKVSKKLAPVLLGMDVTLPELYKIVDANKGYAVGLPDAMSRFDELLETILNSNKNNLSIDVDKSEVRAMEKNVGHINKSISKVTSKKVLKDRVPLGDLVKNLKELDSTVSDTLKLGKYFKMEQLEEIYSVNEEIILKLNTLYKAMSDLESSMDGKTLKLFVDYIAAVAKSVTAVAFIYYLYYQLINMELGAIKTVDVTKEDYGVIDTIGKFITNAGKSISTMVKSV